MNGLISQARQAPAQPQPAPQQTEPQQAGQPQDSASRMKKLQKIVTAAQKVMYSDKTGPAFMQTLKGDDPVESVSDAARNVMLILVQESGMKLDPSLIVPAGIVVVGDILDFMGMPDDEQLTAEVSVRFIEKIMEALGAKQGDEQEPAEGMMPAQQGTPAMQGGMQ